MHTDVKTNLNLVQYYLMDSKEVQEIEDYIPFKISADDFF